MRLFLPVCLTSVSLSPVFRLSACLLSVCLPSVFSICLPARLSVFHPSVFRPSSVRPIYPSCLSVLSVRPPVRLSVLSVWQSVSLSSIPLSSAYRLSSAYLPVFHPSVFRLSCLSVYRSVFRLPSSIYLSTFLLPPVAAIVHRLLLFPQRCDTVYLRPVGAIRPITQKAAAARMSLSPPPNRPAV